MRSAAPSFCTIVRRGQEPQARALAAALRIHHPDSPLLVLKTRRSDRASAAALKPAFLSRVLSGCERLVYLDPDTWVLDRLDGITERLDERSILFIPHRIEPSPGDARTPDEMTFLDRGAYNLGFLALRRDAEAKRFLAWWGERTGAACADAPGAGLYLDQRWCDLAPCLFDGVGILRDARFGAAAASRGFDGLDWRDGTLRAGRARVAFFQFQGVARAPGMRAFFGAYRRFMRESR